ncbi:MAG: hypothetical protein K8S16_06715, partial [Bacteroidales bacterium]|nr:hypothetical protein [Bacteroidales bacterium]
SGVDFELLAVDICLTEKFIAVGSNENVILVSNDLGQTWQTQSINPSVTYGSLTDIKFATNMVGFIVLNGTPDNKVMRTIDAGENWSIVYSGGYYPYAMDFADDMHIAISCGRGLYESGILLTGNNGLTWDEFPLTGFSWGAAKSIVVINDNMELIIAGNMGMMYWTHSGMFWEDLYERTFWGNIYQVQFIDQQLGFALAENQTGGILYSDLKKTTDGGDTWNDIGGIMNDNGAFYFVNEYLGFVTVYDFELTVYKTTNGGQDWVEIESGNYDFTPSCI